jgi:thiol-disulfide isomerase/thioredoxin
MLVTTKEGLKMNKYILIILCTINFCLPELGSQDLRGTVIITGTRIKNVNESPDSVDFRHTYTVCNDTIYVEWLYDQNPNHSLSQTGYQIDEKTYLTYNNDQFEIKTNPPELNSFDRTDWAKSNIRDLTYKAVTKNQEYPMTYLADIDETMEYSTQFKLGGYFPHFLNINGKFERLKRIEPDILTNYSFTYELNNQLTCQDLLPDSTQIMSTDGIEKIDFSENFNIINSSVRQELPQFQIVDKHGNQHSSHSTVYKENQPSKLTYIDFWATTCKPCLKELPFLEELESKYSNEELHIVSVSIDNKSDEPKWKKHIYENNYSWNNYLLKDGMGSPLVEKLGLFFIPKYILLDKNGLIINDRAPRPSNEQITTYIDKLLELNK